MPTTTRKPAARKPATRKPAARKPATGKNGAAGKTATRKSSAAPARAASAAASGKINGPAYKGPIMKPRQGEKPRYNEAVKAFQFYLRERMDKSLKVDGLFGQKTWHCMNQWQERNPAAREINEYCAARTFHSLVNDVKC